jgi:hypothetical protein
VAHNTGQATWTASGDHPFALAYRWLSQDGSGELALPAAAFDLPYDVRPGESVQLSVPVAGRLAPGDYRLAWGMQQRNVLWFHDRGYPDAETLVHVAAAPAAAAIAPAASLPRSDAASGQAPVPRRELWRAALLMLLQHPLLGVGPDNFRHTYGRYLGLASWDARVHANNLYFELLADLGVCGALAFAWLVAPAIRGLIRRLRAPRAPRPDDLWLAGLAASLVAFFVHGTLDYFLEFTSVYLLFWLIVGSSMAAAER